MVEPEREPVHVGVFVAHSPQGDVNGLESFARAILPSVEARLEEAGGAQWRFDLLAASRLSDDDPRRPSDFLDEATLHMAEGPYDFVIVVTDVALVSRRHSVAPGLASRITRVGVLSTRRLLLAPRNQPPRSLEAEDVRANAATLALHLMGHMLGVSHSAEAEDPMAPFLYREGRREPATFSQPTRERVRRRAAHAAEPELTQHSGWRVASFYVRNLARHADIFAIPLLRNRAPVMALAMPSLVTAAVIPIFILVFTAEIWDVGLALTDRVAWTFATVSILASTFYLTFVQNLFFPRKDKRVILPHLAVANAVVFVSILLMVLGLFAMVSVLILLIEFYIFPQGLISTWPTLEDPVVDIQDKLRLAVFVATLGVLTGSLGGGLESRTVIRHLALFEDEV